MVFVGHCGRALESDLSHSRLFRRTPSAVPPWCTERWAGWSYAPRDSEGIES